MEKCEVIMQCPYIVKYGLLRNVCHTSGSSPVIDLHIYQNTICLTWSGSLRDEKIIAREFKLITLLPYLEIYTLLSMWLTNFLSYHFILSFHSRHNKIHTDPRKYYIEKIYATNLHVLYDKFQQVNDTNGTLSTSTTNN